MWSVNQGTGRLYGPDGVHKSTGYSGGNCGANPEGINNHAMESVHDIGPTPCGLYIMAEVVEGSHLGPFAIRLEPVESNDMKGRGDFFVHGDTQIPQHASKGCQVHSRAVREEMWNSGDRQLTVFYAGNEL